MRALAADASSVRATGLKAGVLMVRGPGKDKVSQLMTVLDSVVEKGTGPAHFMYGVLALYGELGAALESELDGAIQLEKLLGRLDGKLSSESESVARGAARGLTAALGGALEAGLLELEEVRERAQQGLKSAALASSAVESRAAAFQIGAACAAGGAEVLQPWGVVLRLVEGGGPLRRLLRARPVSPHPEAPRA